MGSRLKSVPLSIVASEVGAGVGIIRWQEPINNNVAQIIRSLFKTTMSLIC